MDSILLEVSIYSAVIFAAIVLFKLIFKNKLSPVLHYAIWSLLILRLMVPITIESNVNLIVVPPVQEIVQVPNVPVYTPPAPQVPVANQQTTAPIQNTGALTAPQTASYLTNSAQTMSTEQILLTVWILGVGVSLIYLLFAYASLRRRLKGNQVKPIKELLYLFEECKRQLNIQSNIKLRCQYRLSTPALLFRTVLMPMELLASCNKEQVRFMLCHELCHYRRRDHWMCLLLAVLRSVYWFNPIVWLANFMIRTDMETACDNAVVKHFGREQKLDYANTILSMFSRTGKRGLVLAMADTKRLAKHRIKGIYMKSKTKFGTKVITALLCIVVAVACFTTACQPTPDKPVVVSKNDGKFEEALQENNTTEELVKYTAPKRIEETQPGAKDDTTIKFMADIEVPDLTTYPVYSVKRAFFTQEQVDNVLNVLLDGRKLYESTNQRSRDEIQKSIDYYKVELGASKGNKQLTDAYQGILKDLMSEYEKAPVDLKLNEANRKLEFNKDDPQVLGAYGKEVYSEDRQSMHFEWTDDALAKAKADGNQAVLGTTFNSAGKKMDFKAINSAQGFYSDVSAYIEYHPIDTGFTASFSSDEAIKRASEYIKEMKIDVTAIGVLVNNKWDSDGLNYTNEVEFYVVHFKRNVPGTYQSNTQGAVGNQNEGEYVPPVPQETIYIGICDEGIMSFDWSTPMEIVEMQSENASLLPFEQIKERIDAGIKNVRPWEFGLGFMANDNVDAYKVEISRITLSYIMVAKPNSTSEYYFLPVWDVCGDIKYHYPDAKKSSYILDENNERSLLIERNMELWNNQSLLTINAIDGSVVTRGRGY